MFGSHELKERGDIMSQAHLGSFSGTVTPGVNNKLRIPIAF